MKLTEARQIAEKYVKILKPYCERIEIAGSIRREKSDVGDIEIVCVAKVAGEPDFLNDSRDKIGTCFSELEEFFAGNSFKFLKSGLKYKQIILPEGIKLDLFIANKDNFGNIFLMRTGSMEFSRWLLGRRTRQVGLLQKDGYLWRGEERLNCPEEKDVFNFLRVDWIEPPSR